VQPGEVEIWVRVRVGVEGEADVRAVAHERALTGLVVAGPGSLAELSALDEVMSRTGSDARMMPLLHSAAGVCGALAIASIPRVVLIRAAAGEVDAEGRRVAEAEIRRARRLLQLVR
jgi:citrate lyase beta subunit